MAILWRTTKARKTNSYKGYIPMPSTIGEPSFAEKWKRWRSGDPAKFLKYTDLQDIALYCYSKNLSTTIAELEVVFHKNNIIDKETAIKYIDEHMNDFNYFDDYSGQTKKPDRGGNNNNTGNCCCCCKKP